MNLTSTDGATLVAVHADDAEEVVILPPGKHARPVATTSLAGGDSSLRWRPGRAAWR